MSRETNTPVMENAADRSDDQHTGSAEWLRGLYNEPAFEGDQNPYGIYDDGTYQLLSEHLVDSRMVINPGTVAANHDGQPATEQQPAHPEQPVEAPIVPEVASPVVAPEATLITQPEQAGNKKGRLARLRGALGRAASSLLGRANNGAYKALSASATFQEKDAELRNLDRYRKNENDGTFTKLKKMIGRNALRLYAGAFAVAGIGAYAGIRYAGAELSSGHRVVNMNHNDAANAIALQPMEHENVHFESTMIVAGGAGQGDPSMTPIAELQHKGYEEGVDVRFARTEHPGTMGLGPGEATMDQSGDIGEHNMYQQYLEAKASGKPIRLTGYSEGSLVATRTANRIAAENGGVLPDNVKVTLIGTPYHQDGIGNNIFGKALKPVLDHMGIPLDERPPAGTEVVYLDTDPYANAANMNPTTLLKNIIMLPYGTHAIPDMAAGSYTFTDREGIIHTVYSGNEVMFQILKAQGLDVADTKHASAAINAFFPVGKDGQPLPADVRAGLAFGAIAIDNQIAEAMGMAPGSINVTQEIVKNMPPEFKDLGQAGFDAVNNVATLGAEIAAGKIDPVTGITKILGEFQNVANKLGAAFPNPEQGHTPVNNWAHNSARDITNNATGQDWSQQFNQSRDQWAANLAKIAEENRLKFEAWQAEQAAAAAAKAADAPAWTPPTNEWVQNPAPSAAHTYAPAPETPPPAAAAPSAPAAPPVTEAAAPTPAADTFVAPPEAPKANPFTQWQSNVQNFFGQFVPGAGANPTPPSAPRGAAPVDAGVGVPIFSTEGAGATTTADVNPDEYGLVR